MQVEASEETALECVKSVDEEKILLEKEAEELVEGEMGPDVEQRLEDIYARYGASYPSLYPIAQPSSIVAMLLVTVSGA